MRETFGERKRGFPQREETVSGTLYLVATPIGNLGDMSERAVRVLREVDLIACEDTRTSRPLLEHFGIATPLTAYHKFNEKEKSLALIDALIAGKDVALITDAGMPVISDPGSVVVRKCRETGITVTAVPGANAALTALALSGADSRRFIFEGFLPQDNKEKAAVLEALRGELRTTIFYEAPHRLKKTLAAMAEACGEEAACRQVSLCRELTKKFETVETMSLKEAVEKYEAEEPRGEYVLVVEGRDPEAASAERSAKWEAMTVGEHVAYYEAQGLDRKAAMKAAASDRGVTKRDIYQALLKMAD